MSGDLVSLRLLLVAASGPQQDIWREGATQASVPIDFDAGDAAAARLTLVKGGVDVCVLDAELSDDDKAAVIRPARRRSRRAGDLYDVAVRGSGARRLSTARCPNPPMPAQARKLIELCIRVRMPTKVLIAGRFRHHARHRAQNPRRQPLRLGYP